MLGRARLQFLLPAKLCKAKVIVSQIILQTIVMYDTDGDADLI